MTSAAAPALDWERVTDLRPKLAEGTRIHRHCYRGVAWYVVQDGASARHLRLDEGAWRIAGLMDGTRTLAEIHAALAVELGEAGPNHEELVRVLRDLHVAELIECDELADARSFRIRQRHHGRARWRRALASPLSQRIPLFDPQSWLDRWLATVRPLLSASGLAAWFAAALLGLAAAVAHWDAIAAGFSTDVLGAHNLALVAVAYLLVKALHELGHAFATRAFGGEVHEIGVMLLVFMPVPYVDASAAAAFPEKGRRMLIGAVGIMVELFLAVLALGVWITVEPGLVRDLAYNVMLVGGLSTLLFNGNPLLRFDGYYVLCDALEIPNLGPRSTRYLGYLVKRYLCGARDAESPVSAPGERPWFLVYGVASSVYRVLVVVGIVLFVAVEYPVVGVVLGVWAAVSQLLLPAIRGLTGLIGGPALRGRRGRAALVLGVPAALAVVAAATVPLPVWTYAEGIVWLPERAQVRAGVDGFLVRQVAQRGSRVAADELVFALQAPAISTEVTVLERRLEEHQARYDQALFHDRARLEALEEQMARVQAELGSARESAAELLARSPLAGKLLVPQASALNGRYVRKGQVLAYVTDGRPLTTRVVVRQDEIERVRDDTRAVRVKLPGDLDRILVGQIENAVPSATRRLPTAALGALGGGRIAVDGEDPDGRTPAESVFVLDVALPADAPRLPVGTRVYLRFEHTRTPFVAQAVRAARQLLLARFGV